MKLLFFLYIFSLLCICSVLVDAKCDYTTCDSCTSDGNCVWANGLDCKHKCFPRPPKSDTDWYSTMMPWRGRPAEDPSQCSSIESCLLILIILC